MSAKWQNCSTCDGEGVVRRFLFFNLTCTTCDGEGGKFVEIEAKPAPQKESLDFTKHNGEQKKVLHQEPYPNVAHF